MADLENCVLSLPDHKPNIYCRFVDDIYTDANLQLLLRIKKSMEDNSILKFTYELSKENKLPFLDILTYFDQNKFASSVYVKPTDAGICLNGKSECPDQYKETVILSYIKRAWTTCSTYEYFVAEIKRVRQVLVNNSYSNTLIDRIINNFLNKVHSPPVNKDNSEIIPVYYKNRMNSSYKVDENIIKKIINDNVSCKNDNTKLQLIIYYNNLKTKSIVMRNNMAPKKRDLNQFNIIYQFDCPEDECIHHPAVNNVYTGHTQCTLSRRLSFHLQNGAIRTHYLIKHHKNINRKTIEQYTNIRNKENDFNRLEILEALIILNEKPEKARYWEKAYIKAIPVNCVLSPF